MGRERDDRHLHPVGERESTKQPIELSSAVGGIEADRRRVVRGSGRSPEAKEVALGSKPGRRDRLLARTPLDLGLGRPVRNLDLELNQELHRFLLAPQDPAGAAGPGRRHRANVSRLDHDLVAGGRDEQITTILDPAF
jgi:hypothetical protein